MLLALLQTQYSERERAEGRKAPEALQKRAWCVEDENRWEGLWRVLGREPMGKKGGGARRLDRGCEASARDRLCGAHFHLNA